MIDFGLTLTYVLIGIAALACILSPILQMKGDVNKVKKMVAPLILLFGIIGVAFFMSSGEVLPEYINSDGVLITESTSKVVGTSLITFYILSAITIGSVLYSEFVTKLFK